VEATVKNMEKVTLYNIDVLHMIDEENKASRKEIMETHKAIIYKYLSKYYEYEKLKNIRDNIIILKLKGTEIAERRYKVYKNKKYTKDIDVLVETLLESTSKSYVNKAIEVLKEETLKGNGEIALSIIEKIFGRCQ
jgi:glutamyl-tRNA reductase